MVVLVAAYAALRGIEAQLGIGLELDVGGPGLAKPPLPSHPPVCAGAWDVVVSSGNQEYWPSPPSLGQEALLCVGKPADVSPHNSGAAASLLQPAGIVAPYERGRENPARSS